MMKKLWLFLLILLGILGYVQAQSQVDIITLAWDKTGDRLAIGYEGGSISILNTETGIYSEVVGPAPSTNILSVAWHPTNDNLLIVGAVSLYWRVYDVSTNEMVNYLKVGSTSVSSVSWNVDGTLIASAANWVRDRSEVPRIDIWNAFTNELVASFEHGGYINDISWHPTDPYKLASASSNETTRFWDVNLGIQYRPQIFNYGGSTNVVWSPDGSQVAISQGSETGPFVGIWNVDEEAEVPMHQFSTDDYINIAWKDDGSLAISDQVDLKITDVERREIFENISTNDENGVRRLINDLDWSVNGDLAIGGENELLIYRTPNTYYIIDETSDLARFINMANANTSMNIFDMRGDFELTESLPNITGKITIIGDESQLTTLRESGMLSVADGGQLSFEIREN